MLQNPFCMLYGKDIHIRLSMIEESIVFVCFIDNKDLLPFFLFCIVLSSTINNILIVPIMATKQALPSASACMESSIEMRLVAWGMVDDLKK